jgi:PAS domain S-box-containing protein
MKRRFYIASRATWKKIRPNRRQRLSLGTMKKPTDIETERWLRAQVEFARNQLRDLFVEAPAAIALLSGPDHRFVFANRAYFKMSGRRRNEIIGKLVRDTLPELVDQGFLDVLNRVYRTGETFVASAREVNLVRGGRKQTVFVDFTYYPMRNLAGEIEGILFQGIDVTEEVLARTQLEKRVSERTTELKRAEGNLRALNQELMLAQDEERRRLALELHDSVGQSVAALQWKLVSAQENVYDSGEAMAGYIAACLGLAEDISKEIRTISHLLHPPLLDEAGLSRALHLYIEGIKERSGLTVFLEIDPNLRRFPRDLEMTVFRIVQEALTNIHRHARTSEAFVRIYLELTFLRVEIEDRGQGIANFASLDEQKMGIGLTGMQERVRNLSGQFEVQSGKKGTIVKATFPMPDVTI